MKIQEGIYHTKGGYVAHVWNRGKNILDQDCWRGTIEGIGMSTWNDEGKDLSGSESLDLTKPVKKGTSNETHSHM